MTSNPYKSPAAVQAETTSKSIESRPIGVSVCAVILAIPGIACGIALIAGAITEPESFARFYQTLSAGAVTYLAFVFPAGVIAAGGMWYRFKWAWLMALMYCFLHLYAGIRGWIAHGVEPGIHGGVILGIHALILVYLNSRVPREFFDLTLRAAIVAGLGILIGTIALYHALTWVPPLFEQFLRRI